MDRPLMTLPGRRRPKGEDRGRPPRASKRTIRTRTFCPPPCWGECCTSSWRLLYWSATRSLRSTSSRSRGIAVEDDLRAVSSYGRQ